MKKFLFACVAFLFLALVPIAGAGVNVTVGWEYAFTPGDFSHFEIRQEQADGTWLDISGQLTAATRSYVISNLADGTYTWVCVAVDTEPLESMSTELVLSVEDTSGPPPVPQNFKMISTVTVEIINGNIVAYNAEARIEPLASN